MYRRTTGRRWRRRDLRGVPYEQGEAESSDSGEVARTFTEAAAVCPECGEPRPNDERVAAGLPCRYCED
jgi:hypothetical protein